ncbi:unnamed protein product [Withania somnifera]
MTEQKSSSNNNRWSWDVPGFQPRKSPEHEEFRRPAPLPRRYSISVAGSGAPLHSELSKHGLNSKLLKLKDKLKLVREDYSELRQEASDLQEYSNAKLDRVTRYLGVLADKTRKLDQAALETEARISPLISEKKRLFNDLLTAQGNIKVFCRVRPLFEDEGPSIVEFPDDVTVRINTADDSVANPKKDFELDRIYGPHVGQVELFSDIQPFVQSAFDGYNVAIFAYGQAHSGKTHTMEGSSHDRGLYARCFEELFDLSNSDATSTSKYNFSVSISELHNEQIGRYFEFLDVKKDIAPYGNSMLTKVLADSLGGSAKTLLIVNVCPNASNLSETLSSLTFSARARNATLSLGSRDTIKKWREIANDTRKELYDKEKEITDLTQEIVGLKQELKQANDQGVLLFNEVQKVSDLKAENIMLSDKLKIEKDQNIQIRNEVAQLLQLEQEQKLQIQQSDSAIQMLQAKLQALASQLNEAVRASEARLKDGSELRSSDQTGLKATRDEIDSAAVTKKLEEELLKRDALIEKLHEENEKLFDRLTQKASLAGSAQVSSPLPKAPTAQNRETGKNDINVKGRGTDVLALPSSTDKPDGTVALVKSGGEKVKTTPAGEYLTSALNEFDPDQYDSLAAISDGANKLLMLVLAAVIKAGASREHEILAEIRDAVFAFIRKMEPKRVMDTMLVSRVRILYIRSLLARSPELQSIKVPPVERFLEKTNSDRSRSSSRGSSPGRSPIRYDSSRNALVDEHFQGFKVNLKPERKSRLSSVVLKIRGIDQDLQRQHVSGGKLREITEEAKSFAVGNRALAALFVHTPAGELQRQIRNWLAENFDFLSVTDETVGGATGQLELLSTAIMDGWMAGLGAAMPPSSDALGQLLSEYAKRVYNSQLHHLKDIADTLSTEVAEDSIRVEKLRTAFESVDHKRRKILQQMRGDMAILTLEDGSSPIRNPSTAAEDARLASLVSLDGILKIVKDILRQSSVNTLSKSRKKAMLASLDELAERMPSLLDIDHPCAQRHIEEARHAVELITEEDDQLHENVHASRHPADAGLMGETDVAQWNVLQFNTGSTNSFIVKCGANSNSELVFKAEARVGPPKGGEIVRVAPSPTVLENMSLDEMTELFTQLPESLRLLSLARTADGTRARYSRLYRTLAMKVPALRDHVAELERLGVLKDVKSL